MFMTNYLLAPLKILLDKGLDYAINDHNPDVKRIYPKLSYVEQYKCFFTQPTHIIDNIYLGSAYNAACYYQLKDLEIKTIVNMTKEITNYYPEEFTYHKYVIQDNDNDDIKIYLDEIYKIITDSKDNILLHCYMGASRSASVVIYYLMIKHGMSLKDATQYLKQKREVVNLSQNLARNLEIN